MKKSGVLDIINHNFARIRIDSYDSLSIENILTSHVIIVIIHYLLIRVKMNTTIIYFTYFIYIYCIKSVRYCKGVTIVFSSIIVFRVQPNLCLRCHDLLMTSMTFLLILVF